MKKHRFYGIAVATIGVLALAGCSIPQATIEQMQHTHIREYPGKTKRQIFEGVTVWIATNFKSAKHVIQHSDSAAGTIIVKGLLPGGIYLDVDFTLTVDVKDGKARYAWENLQAYAEGGLKRMPLSDQTPAFHDLAEKKFVAIESDIARTLAERPKDW